MEDTLIELFLSLKGAAKFNQATGHLGEGNVAFVEMLRVDMMITDTVRVSMDKNVVLTKL